VYNLKQNNKRREVVAQHYCMVKIPSAGPGCTRLSSGVKGRNKWERGSRWKTRTKNK
jgi:hypothetical protein